MDQKEFLDLLRNDEYLYKIVDMDPNNYLNSPLRNIEMSTRLTNATKRLKVYTVKDILLLKTTVLYTARGFGKTTYEELLNILAELKNNGSDYEENAQTGIEKSSAEIRIDGFSKLLLYEYFKIDYHLYEKCPLLALNLSEEVYNCLLKGGIETVGRLLTLHFYELKKLLNMNSYLVKECIGNILFTITLFAEPAYIMIPRNDGKNIAEIIDASILSRAIMQNREYYAFTFRNLYDDIISDQVIDNCRNHNRNILNNNPNYYLKAFTLFSGIVFDNDFEGETVNDLFVYLKSLGDDILLKFCDWLDTDYSDYCNQIVSFSFSRTNNFKSILENRMQGKTLEEISKEYRITRERVRQIELKGCKRIAEPIINKRIIERIIADNNGYLYSTPGELEQYFGEYYNELIYALNLVKSAQITVLDKYGIIALFDSDRVELIKSIDKFINSMPEEFKTEEVDQYLTLGEKNLSIQKKNILKIVNKKYLQFGSICVRKGTLSLARVYEYILRKYYPNGIHVYDSSELSAFRNDIIRTYGNISLPANDRALTAGIIRVSILCDRGIYKAKKSEYIPEALKDKISNYIKTNKFVAIYSIFSVFEKELRNFGINNKYYLHGILRELFSDEFYFKKDYVSTNKSLSSGYDAICNFIKEKGTIVSNNEIKEKFPGITEIVIALATSDRDIINYFGNYIHIENITLENNDISYLSSVLKTFTGNNQICISQKLFDYIKFDNYSLLTKAGVLNQFSLFSLLQHLFEENYTFERPYIALKGITINKPIDQVKEYLNSVDKAEVSEMIRIVNNGHFRWSGIQNFIDSFNDTHFMISKNQLMRIEEIGITKKDIELVEKTLDNLDGTVRIKEILYKIDKLNLSFTYNEWLLYSAIKKWGRNFEVRTTTPYAKAVPLIAKRGFMNLSITNVVNYEDSDENESIDDLISDLIAEELENEI